jgi:hypothetical protein
VPLGAVGMATPALRSSPFRGPLGYQWEHDYSVASDGSLHILRFAFPLWAALLLSSLPLLDSAARLFLRRRRRALPAGRSRRGRS